MPEDWPDLFAYGTLMVPSIIERVIGRVPDSEPAHVLGFQRFTVKNQNFPGLIRTSRIEDRVDGLLYLDITPEEWDALNAYEDDFYVLEEITVHTGTLSPLARTYVVPLEASNVLGAEPWNLGDFIKHHLPRRLS